MHCTGCGIELKEGQRFCTKCGEQAAVEKPAVKCIYCGVEIDAGQKFCGGCGRDISGEKKLHVHSHEEEEQAARRLGVWREGEEFVEVETLPRDAQSDLEVCLQSSRKWRRIGIIAGCVCAVLLSYFKLAGGFDSAVDPDAPNAAKFVIYGMVFLAIILIGMGFLTLLSCIGGLLGWSLGYNLPRMSGTVLPMDAKSSVPTGGLSCFAYIICLFFIPVGIGAGIFYMAIKKDPAGKRFGAVCLAMSLIQVLFWFFIL